MTDPIDTEPEEKEDEIETPAEDSSVRDIVEAAYKSEIDIQSTEDKEEDSLIKEKAPKETKSVKQSQGASPKDTLSKVSEAQSTRASTKKQISDQATNKANIESSTIIDAPNSWSNEEKQLFKSLPRQAQETVARRERERDAFLTRKSQEQEAVRRFAEPYAEIAQGYKDLFEPIGLQPAEGFKALAEAQRKLQTNFPEAMQQMARANGYEIQLKPLEGHSVSNQYNPALNTLYSKVSTLEQKLAQEEEAKRQYLANEAVSLVERFAKETDEQGELKRPFFDEVYDHLQIILEGLVRRQPDASHQELLTRAYDEAVWANPQTRAKLRALEVDKVRRERDGKLRLSRAERAGSIIRGSPGAGSMVNGGGDSVRDIVQMAFEGRL